MKHPLPFIIALLSVFLPLPVAAAQIARLTVEEPNNYDAINFRRGFAEREWKDIGYRVTFIEGNHELPPLISRDSSRKWRRPICSSSLSAAILGYAVLYRIPPLAPDATPLLLGQAGEIEPALPLAWSRTYGPRKARVFYTSLGAPEDAVPPVVRRLVVNAVRCALSDAKKRWPNDRPATSPASNSSPVRIFPDNSRARR